jgi:hypothetical protein
LKFPGNVPAISSSPSPAQKRARLQLPPPPQLLPGNFSAGDGANAIVDGADAIIDPHALLAHMASQAVRQHQQQREQWWQRKQRKMQKKRRQQEEVEENDGQEDGDEEDEDVEQEEVEEEEGDNATLMGECNANGHNGNTINNDYNNEVSGVLCCWVLDVVIV